MTLFGNILQNPLDPRAKSDTRLMNLVVTFLSMLGQEAEQGGVHRMLGICSEFVRIAKVVIEKAEREQAARRKRKNPDAPKQAATPSTASKTAATPTADTMETSRPGTATTSTPAATAHLSPGARSNRRPSYVPTAGTTPSATEPFPSVASAGWPQDFQPPQNGDYEPYQGMTGFAGAGGVPSPSMPMRAGPFQQPLLPQDLFGLPTSLDWNWAEMSGGAYPSVENGNFGEGQANMQ